MQIYLYSCSAEVNRIDKRNYLATEFILDGTLKDDSSIVNPIILVEKSDTLVSVKYNYMYINKFKRYYWIEDITSYRNNLWTIKAKCDVLMSFASDILNSKAIIDKTESGNLANMYLNDGSFVMDSHKYNQIMKFPNSLNENGEYILIVSGGSGS